MERIACIISNDGTIALMLDGENYSINREHLNYEAIKKALKESDAEKLSVLVDIPRAVKCFTSSTIEVKDGVVYWNDAPLHNSLTSRILGLMEGGFPFQPMMRFLENLMQNPSSRAVSELYDFLENKNLPITEDGCFLAYKGTRADGYDKYSGTILNEVGMVIEVPRNSVDDNREQECSHGLHVGAMEYVKGYCTERVIIVKVNPRDCVSVPRDHNAQKLRVCKYEVVAIYNGDLTQTVYNSDGTEWKQPPVLDWADGEEPELETKPEGCDCEVCEGSDYDTCHECGETPDGDNNDWGDEEEEEDICPDCGDVLDWCYCCACDEDSEEEDEEEEEEELEEEDDWGDDGSDYNYRWNVRDKKGRFSVKRDSKGRFLKK